MTNMAPLVARSFGCNMTPIELPVSQTFLSAFPLRSIATGISIREMGGKAGSAKRPEGRSLDPRWLIPSFRSVKGQ